MIEKIIENLSKHKNIIDNIDEILNDKNPRNEKVLCEYTSKINKNNQHSLKYETNMYFPLIYELKSNCPTCGYRSIESKRQYNSKYIEHAIKYEIDQIKQYNICSINCYNKDENKYKESDVIFKTLDLYNIDKNIKIYDVNDFSLLRKHEFKKIIINQKEKEVYETATKQPTKIENKEIILELNIDDKNILDDIENLGNLKEKNIHSIQLRGYDPFIDVIEEYHPQYTREYLLKIICIMKILYPEIELKIQHAANNNNFYEESIKLGISTITGVYTNKNSSTFNLNEIIIEK